MRLPSAPSNAGETQREGCPSPRISSRFSAVLLLRCPAPLLALVLDKRRRLVHHAGTSGRSTPDQSSRDAKRERDMPHCSAARRASCFLPPVVFRGRPCCGAALQQTLLCFIPGCRLAPPHGDLAPAPRRLGAHATSPCSRAGTLSFGRSAPFGDTSFSEDCQRCC